MKLITCEATGDWAALIRPRLPRKVAIVETRAVDEILDRVAEAPLSAVVVEWSANHAERLLIEIARIDRKQPMAKVIVLSHRDRSCDLAACREAGAVHVVTSRRRINEVIDIIQHLLHSRDWPDDTDTEQDLEAETIARLAWRQ